MENYTVTLNTIIVWLLWLGGVAIMLYDILLDGDDDIGHVGLALIAAAVMRHTCCLANRLEARERDAFELGREAGVRSLR